MYMHHVKQQHEMTTMEEITLLQVYERNKNSKQSDEDIRDLEVKNSDNSIISEWFPNVNEWNIEEIDRENGHIHDKLGSKWSVKKTTKFYRLVDKEVNDKIIRGKRLFYSRWRRNLKDDKFKKSQLELGLGLYKLIEISNKSYGISNWMTKIEESKILKYEVKQVEKENDRITIVFKTKVQLILADNTIVEKYGYGYSDNLSREIAFRKSKKESIGDGLRNCFGSLVFLLFDYEEKVRNGYYTKYK